MDYPCGGEGRCRQCRIQVDPPTESGRGSHKPLPDKELNRGIRLACQVILETSCTITIPEGKETGFVWEEATRVDQTQISTGEAIVTRRSVSVSEPSLKDQRSDWERVKDGLLESDPEIDDPDYALMEDLSSDLRENGWVARLLMDGSHVIRSYTSERERFYGFAIDLGTTTVDVALHNLETGRRIGRKTLLNRQTAFGADVISRAQAFDRNRKAVRGAALETIRDAACMILEETGIHPENVVRSVVVGNPIMIHILHNYNPVQLTLSPYINVVSGIVSRDPGDFDWTFQRYGTVESLPLVSAFVGADTTGMIIALGLGRGSGTSLSIDVGTNGELVLEKEGKLYTTSAAAGPAFEGAQISCGTRAVPGAICDLTISPTSVSYKVLGDEVPNGICGTALIMTISQMLDNELIDETGRLRDKEDVASEFLKARLFATDGTWAFALTEDRRVYITQKDIREVQLAKGAIRTAIDCLLDETGTRWSEIEALRLAGNFGAGMNVVSEMRIGLFPEIDVNKVDVVGNAALRGAALALISRKYRERAAEVTGGCSFLELAGRPDFQMRFTDSMMF